MDVQTLMRDNQKLRKENEELETENRSLMEAVDFFVEALLWTGQAEDYKEGGHLQEGWEAINDRITIERRNIKKLREDEKYWSIK